MRTQQTEALRTTNPRPADRAARVGVAKTASSSATGHCPPSSRPSPSSTAWPGIAEEAQHHPDIDIRYNLVKLALVSHDAGGITARDARMARQLSAGLPHRCRLSPRALAPRLRGSLVIQSGFAPKFRPEPANSPPLADISCVTGLPARTIDRSCRLFWQNAANRPSSLYLFAPLTKILHPIYNQR